MCYSCVKRLQINTFKHFKFNLRHEIKQTMFIAAATRTVIGIK